MRVFISHSQRDRGFVRKLVPYLTQAGCQVWSDAELGPGENYPLAIGKALERSNAMVVVLSPDAVQSAWVLGEIEYALGSPKFKGRLITVEVRPTKGTPWILRKLNLIRASKDFGQTARQIVTQLHQSTAKASA
ncbi:MAG: toll/interleukin-1 receptor domain-containing protein [Planctomycetota bacterium]